MIGPEDLLGSSYPLVQPQLARMGSVSVTERDPARHSTEWRAQMRSSSPPMDVHSCPLRPVPPVAEGLRGFPDVHAAALRCAFSPTVFSPAFPVYSYAGLFTQENVVIIKAIIQKCSLWRKRFDLLRDVYKMVKCCLTQATKNMDLSPRRTAATSSP